MSRTLRPLGDRIVIELQEAKAEDTTASGLILMANSTPAVQNQGTVIAVGPGRILESGMRIPTHVSEGDRVIFNAYAGTRIEHEGREVLILHEGEVIAIINS